MPESILRAGVEIASAPAPDLLLNKDAPLIQKASGHRSEDIRNLRKGVLRSVDDLSSTITAGGSDTLDDLFGGQPTIGESVSRHGIAAAPIATATGASLKTTLSRSTIPTSPAPFPETSYQRASPAILRNKIETHLNGSSIEKGSIGLCPFCRLRVRTSRGRRPRVFLNPPYANGVVEKWMARLAQHGHGTALIFARTETDAFFEQVWNEATALLFMRGRINFHFGEAWDDPKTGKHFDIGDRAPGNAGAPTVLCAYGMQNTDVLAGCDIAGRFVPLRIPRSVLVSLFASSDEDEKRDRSWRQLLAEFFAGRSGPVDLDRLYRHFAGHQKATTNRNFDAKLRQQLQQGPYRRVGRGLWEAAP